MSFAKAVAFVLVEETDELTDNPADPGGLTKYGIALKRHPELTAEDIRAMTPERAAQIYAGAQYWEAVRGDELPDYLHVVMLDTAVVQGAAIAIRSLQTALYLKEDGVLGPRTLAVAKGSVPKLILSRFTAARILHYSRDKTWNIDALGWSTRAVAAVVESLT